MDHRLCVAILIGKFRQSNQDIHTGDEVSHLCNAAAIGGHLLP